jgi:hypothetical protein
VVSEPLGDDFDRVREILKDAESSTRLSDWEQNFLDDLRDRVLRYGDATRMSDKQMAVIDRIEQRLYQ